MIHSEKRIPVLYYHSVGRRNNKWQNSFLTLDIVFFEDHLRYFKRNFNVISLSQYYEVRSGLQPAVRNGLVITFDDGYLDNWIWGFPLLKKYNIKATIFISPEFVEPGIKVRPTLEDAWNGECSIKDLDTPGYLSWSEMRLMEKSGLIDIQSHTMTHTKYFISGNLLGFHPGEKSFYASCNYDPAKKPFAVSDQIIDNILPKGYPLFEEKSAVIARKVEINESFIEQCSDLFSTYDFLHYTFESAIQIAGSLYRHYKERDELLTSIESEEEYRGRLDYEISGSKAAIERELDKKVDFLCWPHGDTNAEAISLALSAGYKAVTKGHSEYPSDNKEIIPGRIGAGPFMNNRYLSHKRLKFKIKRFMGKFPALQIDKIHKKIKLR